MPDFVISLLGEEELLNKLKNIEDTVLGEEVSAVFLEGAQMLRDTMVVPSGPTGNLQRSLVAKNLMKIRQEPASAITAIDYRIAPHAHLVEYGTQERVTRAGKSTGRMPAQPFFYDTWNVHKEEIKNFVMQNIIKLIEGA